MLDLARSQKLSELLARAFDDVTVVIPAFNEAESIATVIADLAAQIPSVPIIVVDDGSRDNTAEIAAAAGALVIRHPRNRGYGAALKTGFRAATTGFVAMYDADGQHRSLDLFKMLDVAHECDVVIGVRQGESYRQITRRPGKWILAKVANSLVGQRIPDLNCGLRVLRRSVLIKYLHLLPNGFSASTTTTVCMLQRGYDVKFFPITTGRRVGKSSVRQLRDGLNTVLLIVRLIVLFNPLRFFLPPAIAMIILGSVYGFVRAWQSGLGIPVLAALVVVMGMITACFGLLADQLSSLRKEMFERNDS